MDAEYYGYKDSDDGLLEKQEAVAEAHGSCASSDASMQR